MHRRLAALAVALLVSGCSVSGIGPPPQYGFIDISAGGTTLHQGSDDVPPTLDLRLHASVPFRSGDVTASLDGVGLALAARQGDLVASVNPLPLTSAHHLAVAVAGRATSYIAFSVIPPTPAMLAAHLDPSSGLVVDAIFQRPPAQPAVAAALPGATVSWVDPAHARISWTGASPASIDLPATVPTADGAHLDPGIHLDLRGIRPGVVRRVTVPPAAPAGGIPLTAFIVDTSASNTSMAFHLGAIAAATPTGWTAQPDGSVLGTPDPSAVARAGAAGIPVYPSLANDPTNPAATDQLLTSAVALPRLVQWTLLAVQLTGYRGVNLDFEGMQASDKDPFTAFVRKLATALHGHGAKLIVDVVPHNAAGVNQYSAAYDVAAIGMAADTVDLMAYDQHADGGSPGPVAGLDWDVALLQTTLPMLTPAHTLLGIPLYARRWLSGAGAAASYGEALHDALIIPGARVDYDFAAATPSVISPSAGALTTYFDDADSLARKIALVHSFGLGGVAAWRLGFEDPAFWGLFAG